MGGLLGQWGRRAGAPCAGLAVFLLVALFSPTGAAAAALPPTQAPSVELIRPIRGDVVSGVEKVVARTSRTATLVRFEWSPDRALWRPIEVVVPSGRETSARWDTTVYNGRAWVRVVAHFGSEADRDVVPVRVFNGTPTVKITASPRAFSPNGDGRKDHTRVRVSSNKDGRIVVRAVRNDGRVVRVWKRRAHNRRVTRIRWNGLTSKGRRVRDGRYRLEAVVTDQLGMKDRDATSVVLDTHAPRVRWRAFHPPSGSKGALEVTFTARDLSLPLQVAAVVDDGIGPLSESKTFERRARRTTIRFKPRYNNGEPFLPGTYFARIRARDHAGNVRTSVPRSWVVYRNVGARTFSRVPNPGRGVALTFDDCNDADPWRSILRTLARYDAHASFFCPGRQVLANPEVARASVRQGHTPGAHGWDHANLSGMAQSSVAWRLRRDRAAWRRTTGVSSVPFFRPPYGASSSSVRAASAETSHFRIMMWDVDPSDYTNPPPSSIASRVLRGVRPGSIVVLHTRRNTAAALPSILRGFRERSLRAESLAELFRR